MRLELRLAVRLHQALKTERFAAHRILLALNGTKSEFEGANSRHLDCEWVTKFCTSEIHSRSPVCPYKSRASIAPPKKISSGNARSSASPIAFAPTKCRAANSQRRRRRRRPGTKACSTRFASVARTFQAGLPLSAFPLKCYFYRAGDDKNKKSTIRINSF